MGKKRCSFVKKGKQHCRNLVIDGFTFCEVHISEIDSLIKYSVPDHIVLEPSDNGRGFIFDSNLGHIYFLNSTGLYIYSMMRENKLITVIAKAVAKRYGIGSSKFLCDFRNFYDNLMEMGLIAPYEEA